MTCAHTCSSPLVIDGHAEGRKFTDQAHLPDCARAKTNKEAPEVIQQHAPKDTDAPSSPPTPDQNEQQSSAAVIYMRRSSSSMPMSQRRVWCLMDYPRSRPLRCRVPAYASDIPPDEAEQLLAGFWFHSNEPPKHTALSKFAEHLIKEEEQEARAARKLLMAEDREYEHLSHRTYEDDMLRNSYDGDTSHAATRQGGTEDAGQEPVLGPQTPASPSFLSLVVAFITCTSCWTSPWPQQDPGPARRSGAAPGQHRDRKRQPPVRTSLHRPFKVHLPVPGGSVDPLQVPLLLGSGSEAEGIKQLLQPPHPEHGFMPGTRRSGDRKSILPSASPA